MIAPRHILLVSYDDRRLLERRMVLEQKGYKVSSALGFKEAISCCSDGSGAKFDLLILGHSIPHAHKGRLIRAFRASSTAPILSLWEQHEQIDCSVDYLAFSDSPDKLLGNVASIFTRNATVQAS
jgi:DNA-binding response OmpR family regulator